MKRLVHLIIFLFILSGTGFSQQYLENPSLEGQILMIGPPPGWEVCIPGSTPNVQPGKYAVYLPPSDGITYVGMITRPDFTWEDMHTTYEIPLSKDSCYIFQIDLAFWENLSWTTVDPCLLRVWGSDVSCQKTNLLWQSPPIANEDWLTYEFMIHPDGVDYTDLILEAYFAQMPAYYGYVLLDNIRITRTPYIELGNDTTIAICSNDSIPLDPGGGFAGYLWQDGSTNQVFWVKEEGLYWVKVFNEEGCSYTDSVYVTVPDYVPMGTELLDSTMVCKGQPVIAIVSVVNGIPPYSFEWEDLPDTTGIAVIIADSTRFYNVTVTDHCGYSIQDSIKIIVLPGPDIDLGGDTLICIEGSYTIHAGSGYQQYQWQNGSTDSVLTITEAGTYWVTVTDAFGCSSSDTISITLFPPVYLDIGSDTTLCEGEQLVIHAGPGFVQYVWQDNSSDSVYTASLPGIYWVTVTDLNGCTASDSISLDFLPQPEVFLGNDTVICAGDDFVLDAGEGFISYLWQDNDTSQYYPVTLTGTYSVTVSNGCGEASDAIYIEVLPSPAPDLGADTTICNGQSLVLSPGSFYSYLWQDNTSLPEYTVTSSGEYSVTVTNFYGCSGSDEILVSISDPNVDLGGVNHVCEGDSLVLDAGEGFDEYLWQDNSTGQTLVVYTTGTYSVDVVDQYGCAASGEIDIQWFPEPVADLGSDREICEGDEVVLEGPHGDFSYFWNGMPGGESLAVSTSGNYSLTVMNICDTVTDEVAVTVSPLPLVYLGEDRVIMPGESIQLDAGEGFDEYVWQDGSGNSYFVITENNIDPDNPYYYVEVTEGICKSSDTVEVVVAQVWVPKVITLNGDGDNEIFRADLQRWKGIEKHKMVVFNRWGEKVWESADFVTGWDGKQNGRFVADGTYFWILEVFYGSKEIKQVLKGSLTVLGGE